VVGGFAIASVRSDEGVEGGRKRKADSDDVDVNLEKRLKEDDDSDSSSDSEDYDALAHTMFAESLAEDMLLNERVDELSPEIKLHDMADKVSEHGVLACCYV